MTLPKIKPPIVFNQTIDQKILQTVKPVAQGIKDLAVGAYFISHDIFNLVTGCDRKWGERNSWFSGFWKYDNHPWDGVIFRVADTAARFFYGAINTVSWGGTHYLFNQKLGMDIEYFSPPPKNVREQTRYFLGGLLTLLPVRSPIIRALGKEKIINSPVSRPQTLQGNAVSNALRSDGPQSGQLGIPTPSVGMSGVSGLVVIKRNPSPTESNGLSTQTQTSFQVAPSIPLIPKNRTVWNQWTPPPKIKTKSNPHHPENYEMPGVRGPAMESPKPNPAVSIIGFPSSYKSEESMVDPQTTEVVSVEFPPFVLSKEEYWFSPTADPRLTELLQQVEIWAGEEVGVTTFGEVQQLLERLKKGISEELTREEKEALALEVEGFLLAMQGLKPSTEVHNPIPETIDFSTLGAAELLGWIRNGVIEIPSGKKKWKEGVEKLVELFSLGMREVFSESTPPDFFRKVAAGWGRLLSTNQPTLSEEVSKRIGNETGVLLQSLWRLGRAGGVPLSLMKRYLHQLDLVALIRAKGWLLGEIARLQKLPTNNEESIELQSAFLLEKNQGTILSRAASTRDPDYPQKVAQALPAMLQEFYQLIEEIRRSHDPVVLEGGVLLGGEISGERKGNLNSIIYQAIASGTLITYIEAIRGEFIDGNMLRRFYEGVEEFRMREQNESAELLDRNKGSILYHALCHGKLDYVETVVAAIPQMLEGLSGAKERLLQLNQTDVAEVLNKNKGSILSHALTRGKLDYVETVAAAIPKMLDELRSAREKLLIRNETDVAEVLDKNKGSILNHALNQGKLDYVETVAAAIPNMLNELRSAREELLIRNEADVAEVLDKNKGSILSHALTRGKLYYMEKVVEAIPKMLDELKSAKERLLLRNETEIVEVLDKNKGTILNHALNQGKLDYVGTVERELSKFIQKIDRLIQGLKQRREDHLAQSVEYKKKTIISKAIDAGKIELAEGEGLEEWVLEEVGR